jgi:hypothetical protein
MLDAVKRKIGAAALGSLLRSLAESADTKTTIAGVAAGAVIAIPGLSLDGLLAGDPGMIGRLVAGLLVAVIGYLATKKGHDGQTTAVGAVAGVLQASSGSVSAITTGVVIALLGYLTNKPMTRAGGKP